MGYDPRGATLAVTDRAAASPTGPTAGAAAPPAFDGPPWKRARRGGRGGGGAGRGADAAAAPAQLALADAAAPAPPAAATGVCFAFNVGACKKRKGCRFPHRCSVCGAEHAAQDVPACKSQIDARGAPLQRPAGRGNKGGGK